MSTFRLTDEERAAVHILAPHALLGEFLNGDTEVCCQLDRLRAAIERVAASPNGLVAGSDLQKFLQFAKAPHAKTAMDASTLLTRRLAREL